jgi:CDP-glucose 4,6-dehydratase
MEGLVMSIEFWEQKKVLITGHTGFKGSWLSLWLQTKGARVIGYSLPPPTNPSLFEMARIAEGMISITGDIRDFDHIKDTMAEHKPEIIFHMAAQSLVHPSYKHPVDTYSTNVMGTVNVLESVRQTDGVRVVVNVTSDKCYENREWAWGYRENEPMGGHDPYSSSKGCAELVTSAYRNSYFPPEKYHQHQVAVASVRAGNVVGGGDWAEDRLIPDIMNAILENRPVIIRNPHAVRPWQYVLEPLFGYLLLAKQLWVSGPEFSEGWNFGPNYLDAKPVLWIVEQLIDRWGEGASWTLDLAENPHENQYLRLDSSKARTMLGWSPKLDLSSALEWIVEWYHGYQQKTDLHRLTAEQIARYERLQG